MQQGGWEGNSQRAQERKSKPCSALAVLLECTFSSFPFLSCKILQFTARQLGGTALRAGVPRENFRVLHGPSASAIASAPACEVPCPPLALGSRLQPGFWSRILTDDAKDFLAEQHLDLQIEVDERLEGPEQRLFYLRNLSELSMKVEGAPEGHDSVRFPMEDGRWQLHHGDTVLLNLRKGSSMWMCFREFAAKALKSRDTFLQHQTPLLGWSLLKHCLKPFVP
ncbi:unnamed protein product [Symbiodinium natans]|uniref:Uncharacterized protein n=1 Tax=Symbiodinium natans TaxID=878477 RepID=A0A812RGC1_9DINO|nr:unnamed protein product [Symbiodinium natans]